MLPRVVALGLPEDSEGSVGQRTSDAPGTPRCMKAPRDNNPRHFVAPPFTPSWRHNCRSEYEPIVVLVVPGRVLITIMRRSRLAARCIAADI